MATMNVSLPDQMREWIETRTQQGRYSNASDYVRALIRKDQERESAIAVLQSAVTEAMESGEPKKFDAEAFKQDMRRRHADR
jgi:antitoxin ParD1/3/4